jgi:hypothetical protein
VNLVATEPLFELGQTVATPGALRALEQAHVGLWSLLRRHLTGDWGDLDREDAAANDNAVHQGLRLLSAYQLPTGQRIWIITEAGRSVTTFLLPEDY